MQIQSLLNGRTYENHEATDFKTTSGKKLDIDPPVKAPNKLAKTRADDEPKKTAKGLFEVPLKVRVAN